MNIIKTLTARIEEYRATNKNPCLNYATEVRAEKEAAACAARVARYFTQPAIKDADVVPARYVVFKVEAWGRWVYCIDMSEILQRSNTTGGYLGIAGHVFTY